MPDPKPSPAVLIFEPGQRVHLLSETIGTWRDPRVERMAKLQRPGTVRSVVGTALPPKDRSYFVSFDVARRGAKPVHEEIPWNCLELLP